MAFRTEPVDVAGCRVHLRRGGAGRPLLYLHGMDGAAEFPPILEELSRSYDVWLPQHPGFGHSAEPEWLDTIHDLAYFYLDFLEAMKLEQVHLVASSLGGWLALEMAVRSTARMRALTVIAPPGIYRAGLLRGDPFLWTAEERVRNVYLDQSIPDAQLAKRASPEDVEIAQKNFHTFARLAWEPRLFDPHLHKWLHRIQVPVQIVWGDSDRLLPPAYAEEFRKLLPHARVDLIERCGHNPHIEKPREFLARFAAFTAKLPAN